MHVVLWQVELFGRRREMRLSGRRSARGESRAILEGDMIWGGSGAVLGVRVDS